ncbi:MAG TPA: hypothetical protein VLG50_03920 [Candidatus Saccharimonadales bacterium]|nr:hypothetical protein [Candidatus Saccharimonadales bacterium]
MNKYVLLVCALTMMNYETINTAAAAQSSSTCNPFEMVQFKKELLTFLDSFFTTKSGRIKSTNFLEHKDIKFQMPDFNDDRDVSCEMQRNLDEDLLEEINDPFYNSQDYKEDISRLIYKKFGCQLFRFLVDYDKFLNILFCQRGGVIEFKNSELYIEYHDESEDPLKAELKQLIALQNRQLVMQENINEHHRRMQRQLLKLQKVLEQRKLVSTSVQTEQI